MAFPVSRRAFVAAAAVLAARPALAIPVSTAVSPDLLARAQAALQQHRDRLLHVDRIGIVDFTRASREPRFHVVDLIDGSASAHLVAHGRGSDPAHTGWVSRLSNEPGSFASSAGAYATGALYEGAHGHSMRLGGLDADNSNAEARALVVHAAWYVSPEIAQTAGKLGRSEGCFAVSSTSLDVVLRQLGPGRLLFASGIESGRARS